MHSRATLPGVRKANPFAVIVISARLQACVLSNLHLQYTSGHMHAIDLFQAFPALHV
jgi:hypothetical protein